jgi:hypothetical protein
MPGKREKNLGARAAAFRSEECQLSLFVRPMESDCRPHPKGCQSYFEPAKMRVAPLSGQRSRNSCALRQLRAQSMFVIVEEHQSGAIV